MPDPRRFVQGLVVAAVVSLLATRVLAVLRPGPATDASAGRRGVWLGALAGLAAGWYRLGYTPPWPPATGLDRLLMVVIPVTVLSDLVLSSWPLDRTASGDAGGHRVSRLKWLDFLWWGLFCLAIPVILLWKSVYFDWLGRGGVPPVVSLELLASGVCLGLGGQSLLRLSARCADGMVPVGIASAVLTAGLCVLLAGYIKGGAVAFPLAGSLLGSLAAIGPWRRLRPLTAVGRANGQQAVVAAGIVALYGVLLVGCAFGKLPGMRGLLVGAAPLAGWIVELPPVRRFSHAWRIGLGLLSISLVLAMALVAAGLDFERSLGPLVR